MPATIPYLTLEEMIALFGYVNERAAKRAIVDGSFPVNTYKLAGKRVANVSAVNRFFDSHDD
jgi:hypothetical protein